MDYIIKDTTLSAIADSIRAKTGSSDPIAVADMATQIDGITGGGGGSVDGYATVTFMNGAEVLFSRLVMVGDDCPDPYVQNRIELPTKESTAQCDYTFNGWSTADGGSANSNALKGITEDKVLYAAYSSAVRYYTISFYDGDTLKAERQFAYGETPGYEITKDGYSFDGWTPTPVPVTGDASYYASWSQKLSFAGSSWSDISDVCEAGEASKNFKVGDTRTITAGDYTYVLRIVGIDLDEKADGSGKAGLTIMVDSPATDSMAFAPSTGSDSAWGKSNCAVRTWLQTTFLNRLSDDLRAVIKTVNKTTKYSYEGSETVTTQDTIFLPSYNELAGTTTSTFFDEGTGIVYEGAKRSAGYARYFKDVSGENADWWMRPTYNNDAGYVLGTGSYTDTTMRRTTLTNEKYVRPFFCI